VGSSKMLARSRAESSPSAGHSRGSGSPAHPGARL
jgi:hypothetical protein